MSEFGKNVSTLEEFKKQILDSETQESNVIDLSDLGLSEDVLNTIEDVIVQPKAPPPQKPGEIKVQKNLVLAYASDASGCGFIRCHLPMSFLHFVFGRGQKLIPQVMQTMIFQEDILVRTRVLFFQRNMDPRHVQVIKSYKDNQPRLGYKMVYEIDDHIWWEGETREVHGVPDYNFGSQGITQQVKEASIEIMKMMDLIVVSTDFLGHYINNVLGIQVPTMTIPNYAAKFFWRTMPVKRVVKNRIEKPKIIYTGSPTHYSNEKRLYGDWIHPAWREFIIKNVKEDKISFTCFGGLPWFFEEIKDKIKVIGWVNSYSYHVAVLGERADIGLMPLTPNNFNRGKSDIKYVEYAAANVVAIGCYFSGEKWAGPYKDLPVTLPYNCKVADIEKVVESLKEPTTFNKVLERQNDFLDKEGRWLESPMYVNRWVKAFE